MREYEVYEYEEEEEESWGSALLTGALMLISVAVWIFLIASCR